MHFLALTVSVVMLLLIHIMYAMHKIGKIFILVVHYEDEIVGDEVIRLLKDYKYQLKSKTMRGSLTEMTVELFLRTDSTVFLENIKTLEGVQDVTLIQYNGEYHG